MKRFYSAVAVDHIESGWMVTLDGRSLQTQGGRAQVLPTEEVAELLATEWREQGDEIDPAGFRHRDMADYAIDVIAKDPASVIDKLMGYGETDTLCYHADPEDALYRRQQAVWEPLLAELEQREGIRLRRISGILHRAQPEASLARLRDRLRAFDPFRLAALEQLTTLAASLCIGLAALEPAADADRLWDASNLEEDWQADLWGRDEEAQARRDVRRRDFKAAHRFAMATVVK